MRNKSTQKTELPIKKYNPHASGVNYCCTWWHVLYSCFWTDFQNSIAPAQRKRVPANSVNSDHTVSESEQVLSRRDGAKLWARRFHCTAAVSGTDRHSSYSMTIRALEIRWLGVWYLIDLLLYGSLVVQSHLSCFQNFALNFIFLLLLLPGDKK